MANILQITPHRIFPPRGGRRAFFYPRELARHGHDVHVLLPQAASDFEGSKEGYVMPSDVTIHSIIDSPAPRTIFSLLPDRLSGALQSRWLRRSPKGPASGVVLQYWHLLADILTHHRVDIAIIDHIQTLPLAALIARLSPGTIRMLNAHNVDALLYERLAEGTANPIEAENWRRRAGIARRTESALADVVHGYWACSETDHQELQRMNRGRLRGYAIPNGIASEVLPFDGRTEKRDSRIVIFCGSLNYEPNIRGLNWFAQHIWPRIAASVAGARLKVVGYGAKPGDFVGLRSDPTIDFVGEVEHVVPAYYASCVSVVPILEGSGTRVKILEAMALGNPVVSTTIGAEGIDVTDGNEAFLRDDPVAFSDAVIALLTNGDLFDHMRQSGKRLVDTEYDWRVVGDRLNASIDDMQFHHAGT